MVDKSMTFEERRRERYMRRSARRQREWVYDRIIEAVSIAAFLVLAWAITWYYPILFC